MKSIDVDSKFGRLTVIKVDGMYCHCKCECNTYKTIYKYDLLNGKTKSCGCLRSEVGRNGPKHKKHGKTDSKEWRTWQHIIMRCYNSTSTSYYNYGAKGVTVCDLWLDKNIGFQKFYEYIGDAPSEDHSIDRIDNSKGYEPGNVRWATAKEQARNRTNNVTLTAYGKTQCISAWAEESGLSIATISCNLRKGLSPENALKRKSKKELEQIAVDRGINKKNNIILTAFGKTQALSLWAKEMNLNKAAIYSRLNSGWPVEDALSVKSGAINNYYKNYANKPLINGKKRTDMREYYYWDQLKKKSRTSNIEIELSWLEDNGFENFYNCVGPIPSPKHKLQKIDVELGYKPGNLVWVDPKDFTSHKSNIIKITAFGVTKTIMEWSKQTGIKYSTLKVRLKKGWDHEKIVSVHP